jgi:hypothetical protein
MGASVSAPLDEYSDFAIALIRALRDRPPDAEFADAVRSVVPNAGPALIGDLELAWTEGWIEQ